MQILPAYVKKNLVLKQAYCNVELVAHQSLEAVFFTERRNALGGSALLYDKSKSECFDVPQCHCSVFCLKLAYTMYIQCKKFLETCSVARSQF